MPLNAAFFSTRVCQLLVIGLCLMLSTLGQAQKLPDALQADSLPVVPTHWRLTQETWRLPAGETMGMGGGTLLMDVGEPLRLGVGSYGAVRGERGGFITLGLAAELNPKITPRWAGSAGLYVGAGGGRGGGGGSSSLAGGGLMLRSHAGLSYDTQRWGKIGFGLSHVRFPSGAIQSTQPYLLYEHSFTSWIAQGWMPSATPAETLIAPGAASRPVKHQEFAGVYRHYRIPSSVVQASGAAQYGSMQLLGAEWLTYLDERWFLKLEAEGAMGGRSSGYMQILAGAGYRLPLGSATALKFHAAVGPAGGGNTDTGGGLLVDGGLALQQKLSRTTALELSLGQVRAPSASFKADSLALKLSHQFGLPQAVDGGNGQIWGPVEPQSLRIRTVEQTYLKDSANWRTSNTDSSVHNLGVQLDYFFPPSQDATRFFITGQGLAAYAGKAGAYMTGLLGAGAQLPVGDKWFVEGEGLVGAAGGGGLSMGNGWVGQINAGVGYRLSKSLAFMGTAGYMTAWRGDFRSKVLGVSLAYQWTGWTQK